ncbi:HAMP domain-containing histidine kinase [Burkholderiaceae bacterium DAT-1]|nr:HAMP domain-containing histidine kinase [Burkholderiaceae bacterium DAT-1]
MACLLFCSGVTALCCLLIPPLTLTDDIRMRLLVLAILAVIIGVPLLLTSLRTLQAGETPIEEASPPPVQDALDMMSRLHALEARLDHAPIALFRQSAGQCAPLNTRAHRLIAPGRFHPPIALYGMFNDTPGDHQQLVSFESERGAERVLFAATTLLVAGQQERLIALLPVESELEAETLHAWQQLVHVLTHEIMNSLTPVASLSRTALELMEISDQDIDARSDLHTALEAISRRADSLAAFVSSYRRLSALPAPIMERTPVSQLFARLEALIRPEWDAVQGHLRLSIEPPTVELMCDSGQLEQAFINLARNALEACRQSNPPCLNISARLSKGGRLRIEVSDNGPGVPDAITSQIFTPFFSTKSKGRGIGLALVRQLVHNNHGTVRLAHGISQGARFILTF